MVYGYDLHSQKESKCNKNTEKSEENKKEQLDRQELREGRLAQPGASPPENSKKSENLITKTLNMRCFQSFMSLWFPRLLESFSDIPTAATIKGLRPRREEALLQTCNRGLLPPDSRASS